MPTQADQPSPNRRHWERLGAAYGANWEKPARRVLSELEMAFVLRHAGIRPLERVLDVGIGEGRVLEHLLSQTPAAEIWGVDIAAEMVAACRSRFRGDERIKGLQRCDLSRDTLPYAVQFDLVTAIRMLKYNANWREVLGKLVDALRPGGMVIFTMPSTRSLNRVSRAYDIPWYATTHRELERVSASLHLHIVEMNAFTKLPAAFYDRSDSDLVCALVLGAEKWLARVLGGPLAGRELFVAATKGA